MELLLLFYMYIRDELRFIVVDKVSILRFKLSKNVLKIYYKKYHKNIFNIYDNLIMWQFNIFSVHPLQ